MSLAMPILIAVLIAAAPAAQQSKNLPESIAPQRELADAELRARIEAYLGSIDTPIRPEHWRALGAKAAAVLEEMALDPQRLPTRRARALEGLSIVGSPRAPQMMVELAQREGEPAIVRMSAMRGAGRLLGPEKLVPALKPVLAGSKDPYLRATAAEVLAHRSPSAGCAAVKERIEAEATELRGHFDRAVRVCDER